MTLSDTDAAEVERLLNVSIHELVFANQQASDDQLEDALTTLLTARTNIATAEEFIAAAQHQAQQPAPTKAKQPRKRKSSRGLLHKLRSSAPVVPSPQ